MTQPLPDDPLAPLAQLKSDAAMHRQRILSAPTTDAKRELANEVWPWLEQFVETIHGIFEEQEEIIDELIGRTQSSIQHELAAKILGVFEVGKQMAAAFEKVLPLVPSEHRAAVGNLIHTYRAAADAVSAEVGDAMVLPGDGDEEDEDEPEIEEDDGGDEDDGEDEAQEEKE